MYKIFPSGKIYISKSNIQNAGRGVFASRLIKKGEIIESCPIIVVSKYDSANLNESILVTYFLYFGTGKEKAAVILGFGSIYNHSHIPNAKYKLKPKKEIIEFIALKNISAHTEITFSYVGQGNKKDKKFPLWFEV